MVSQKGDTARVLTRLSRLLGDNFVRYVLSLEGVGSLEDVDLTPQQQQVVQLLARQATAEDIGDAGALDAYTRVAGLSNFVPDAHTSLLNVLRTMTGGDVEEVAATGDVVADALIELARDLWPIYLIRPQTRGSRTFWLSSPIGTYNHPAFGKAIDAFISDVRLMKLFPYPPEAEKSDRDDAWTNAVGYNSLIYASSGHGGSLQMVSLIPNLLTNGVFRCLIAGEELSLANLVPHIAAATEALRLLADGQAVEVPALVGFSGVNLPEGCVLNLPDGHLRQASATDRDLFMAGAEALTTVLETTFPLRVYSVAEHKFEEGDDPFKDFSRFQPRIAEATRSFGHMIDLVRLALLLASSADEPWLLREVARYIPDPLAHGGTSFWEPGVMALPGFELDATDFAQVAEWHSLIKRKHVRSLDIGMRRLLSASTQRTDPTDAFVDAVICWENIFGVRTETTFRVTASIAKLLMPSDASEREGLQNELKALYAKRSSLVHGGAEPKPVDVDRFRQRAIAVAADCFRSLYRDRADLLDLSSDARGARLLLE